MQGILELGRCVSKLTRSSAARMRPMPAASSSRARRAWPFRAEEAAVVVGRSSPALQSVDPPILRRLLGGTSAASPAAVASESRAERPEATRRDERLRRSARLRRGGVEAWCASGSANLRRSSSEDAFATRCTDTAPCCGGCFRGVVAIDGGGSKRQGWSRRAGAESGGNAGRGRIGGEREIGGGHLNAGRFWWASGAEQRERVEYSRWGARARVGAEWISRAAGEQVRSASGLVHSSWAACLPGMRKEPVQRDPFLFISPVMCSKKKIISPVRLEKERPEIICQQPRNRAVSDGHQTPRK